MSATWPPTRILVPMDFSEPSDHALRQALALAATCRAVLVVVHVGAPLPPLLSPVPEATAAQAAMWTDLLKLREAQGTAELRARVDAICADTPVQIAWREGETAVEIAEAARALGCDLIVIGSHGRTGLKRALLGSVAERTARLATVPVLITKS